MMDYQAELQRLQGEYEKAKRTMYQLEGAMLAYQRLIAEESKPSPPPDDKN